MTMKLPNDFDHFWEGSKKPKSCPWTLQKSCWQLLSIIPGDQTLLARYCKKANTLQSSRSSPGKKVLIGHRCSHPGDGGKKIGDPSPVHGCVQAPKKQSKMMAIFEFTVVLQKLRSKIMATLGPLRPEVKSANILRSNCKAFNFYGRISSAPGHT